MEFNYINLFGVSLSSTKFRNIPLGMSCFGQLLVRQYTLNMDCC